MAVKICNKCGEFNSVSSMICANCGEVLNNAEVIDQGKDYVKKIKCPSCGESIDKGLLKCPECGELITKKVDAKSYSTKNDNKSSNWVAYIFSLLIPLVGFIVGAIMLTKDDKDKKSVGTTCLILGVVSIILSFLIYYFLL